MTKSQHFKKSILLTNISKPQRVAKNIQNENLNVTIIDMINVIVVLIMIETPIMIMKDIIMDTMTTQDTSLTTYSLNTIHDTLTMIEST